MEVAPGITRLGTPLLNWHLVEAVGRYTVVDAGLPGYRRQLDPELLPKIDAVILTHAHADHVGVAELLRRRTGARVLVHRDDAELAGSALKMFGPKDGTLLPYLGKSGTYGLLGHIAKEGGLRPRPIHDFETFGDGDTLDVPGSPRVLVTPGHTAGHVSFLFEGRALLVGDALCSLNPLTRETGPQVLPRAFAADAQQQLDSLEALAQVEAPVTLFGHGEPWREPVADAVSAARRRGLT